MSLDGGGWTLVWKNSFLDNLPLSDNMRYYSGYYKPCTSVTDRGWCNVPKKADKFSPKEQMIVAYHYKHVVYAYKGLFNRNIDYDWTRVEEFYWTLRRLWTNVHSLMAFNQLQLVIVFLASYLRREHHTRMVIIVIQSGDH